eukprot:SAG31_NODE_565_length_14056_cov_22.573189_8_plen_487_part_00
MATAALTALIPLTITIVFAVDIHTVSNLADVVSDDQMEEERKLDCIGERTAPIRYIIYGLVGATIFCSFIISPFVYFWYEVEDTIGFEPPRRGTKICAAVKYVVSGVALLSTLSVVALTVRLGHSLSSLREGGLDWIDTKWSSILQNNGTTATNFVFMCLALVGSPAWICYTAVGAAALPIHTFQGQRHVVQIQATQAERERLLGDRYDSIRSKRAIRDPPPLSRREQRDAITVERERVVLENDRFQLQQSQTTVNRVFTAIPILRIPIGLVASIFSLVIVASVSIAAVDATVPSHNYGLKYGFVLSNATASMRQYNVLEFLFQVSCTSSLWFLNFMFLCFLGLYLLICTMYGMFIVGMPGLGLVAPLRTAAQTLVGAACVLSLTMLTMAIVLPTWAPYHFTYGCQENHQDANAVIPCTRATEPATYCIATQLSLLSTFSRISIPVFGVWFYATNLAFVGVFLVSFLVSLCRVRATTLDEVDVSDW